MTRVRTELDIPEELLDQIPELDGGGAAAAGANPFAPLKRSAPTASAEDEEILELTPLDLAQTPASGGATDVTLMFHDMRREMETAFGKELDRVETSFHGLLRQMEAKLQQTQAELHAARAENERAKTEHARKAEALRELKRALDKI